MDKKRIFLIRNVASGMFGGGETYQLKLARLLEKSGFEVFIVSSSLELIKAARRNGFKTLKAPYEARQNWSGWRNILFLVYYTKVKKLRRWYKKIFERYQPSVINVQSRDDWIAATSVAKKMGIRVLWTDHMDFRSWVLTNVGIWYKNWIGKWVLKSAKKADKIIMISDYEKRFFDSATNEIQLKNVAVIKNGVDDEYEKYGEERKNLKIKSFCYVGRIVDYKGIDELIKAFKIVAAKYPQAKLNVFGDGDIKRYKKLCEGYESIEFCGRTDEPLKALAENEIFILPSYREGLSLSLLDAAMMGKKIIASDVDGNPEVVVNGKTGLLVPAKNVQKLAEAMIWMLEHKKEAEVMSRNARKRYENYFNIEKIFGEKMLPLYNGEKEKK